MAALTREDIVILPNGQGALQVALGTTESAPAALILFDGLNIWSKVKPVIYPQYAALTAAQFKGTAAERLNGYFWGVKVFNDGLAFDELPNFSFDYHRPSGGSTSPGRLSDFIGYDHTAIPTLSGIMDSTGYRDLPDSFLVMPSVDVSGTNTTGIDVVAILSDNGVDLTDCYVFLAIGEYMCALKNRDYDDGTGNYRVTPFYYDNAWQSFFLADLNALRLISESAIPVGTMNATAFLVRYNASSGIDYSGAWQHIGGTGQQAFTEIAVPIPFCAGKSISIETFGTYPPTLTLTMPTTASSRGINIGYSFESTPSENVVCEVTATLTNASTPSTKIYTYTPGGELQFWSFAWEDFGFIGTPLTGSMYDLSVVVRYRYESSEHWLTTSGNSTIIVE